MCCLCEGNFNLKCVFPYATRTFETVFWVKCQILNLCSRAVIHKSYFKVIWSMNPETRLGFLSPGTDSIFRVGRIIFIRGRIASPLKVMFLLWGLTHRRGRISLSSFGICPHNCFFHQGQKHTTLNFIRAYAPFPDLIHQGHMPLMTYGWTRPWLSLLSAFDNFEIWL